MECFNPVEVRGRFVPCGKCLACQYNKRSDWFVRLKEEYKVNKGYCLFFTLTYDEDNVPTFKGVPCVYPRDVTLFLKRLRSSLDRLNVFHNLRYFITEEYGPTTFRPHYHGILFNFPWNVDYNRLIDNSWKKGFTNIKLVTSFGAFNYVAKYTISINKQLYPECVRPRCFASKGLGKSFVGSLEWQRMCGLHEYCIRDRQIKRRLPRYYVQFLTDEQHEEYLLQVERLRMSVDKSEAKNVANAQRVLELLKKSKL